MTAEGNGTTCQNRLACRGTNVCVNGACAPRCRAAVALGRCVPASTVLDQYLSASLKAADDPSAKSTQTDSIGAAYLCVPLKKVQNESYLFPVCASSSIGASLSLANQAGKKAACTPQYVVSTSQQSLLSVDGCQSGELCTLCTNPLSSPTANAPTGACP